jgi:hypothetical protein
MASPSLIIAPRDPVSQVVVVSVVQGAQDVDVVSMRILRIPDREDVFFEEDVLSQDAFVLRTCGIKSTG